MKMKNKHLFVYHIVAVHDLRYSCNSQTSNSLMYFFLFFVLALSSANGSFSECQEKTNLFSRLCPLLVIRLLPLRVFDDLNSPLVYGKLINESAFNGMFLR